MSNSAGFSPTPHDPPGSVPRSSLGCWPIVLTLCIGVVLIAFMFPSVRRSREAARRTQCKNNLKQIGLALHNYHDTYQAFPPAYTVDAEGKPLHSWRTLILPYIDQAALYNTIDLTKPWDDPVNAKALATALPAYSCPSVPDLTNQTTYQVVVAPGSIFAPEGSLNLAAITDGTENTLAVIELPADHAVPWMAPRDADEVIFLSVSKDSKLPHSGGTHALMCDGRVRFLGVNLAAGIRKALITAAAGDEVGEF